MGEGPPKSQPVLKVLREAMEKSKCGTGLSDVTTQYSGDKARQGGSGGVGPEWEHFRKHLLCRIWDKYAMFVGPPLKTKFG